MPGDLFDRLQEYQKKLARLLQTVGALSVPKAFHPNAADACDTLMLRTLQRAVEDKPRAVDKQSSGQGPLADPDSPSLPHMPISQKDILADIVRNKRSYLLLARVGTGKSVMLESFARQMIDDAKPAISAHSLSDGVRIPLLVRLRDFNGLKKNEIGIKRLLDEAERKLFAGDESPVLQPEHISFLAKAGVLVPLFDGFDEFAYRGIFCEQLRQAFRRPDLLGGCSCFVTSRPGVDIMQIPVETKFHRTIDPLTEAEVREYITVKRVLPLSDLETAPAAIRRLLPQPLYLSTWCNCIARGQVPATLGDLMHELFVDYLERRGIVKAEEDCADDGKADANRKKKIDILHDLFARVCMQLALAGFGNRVPWSKLTGLTDKERRRLGSVVRRAGIIERIPSRSGDHEIYVNQIPVVEHLVGWELAQAFRKDGRSGPRIASLDVFRKWVWQPTKHDALDHCFDALWNSGDAVQAQVARALTQWLTDVSNTDLLAQSPTNSTEAAQAHCSDDLLRPFCVTALRLINLNQGLKADDSALARICSTVVQLVQRTRVWNRSGRLRSVTRSLCPLAFTRLVEEHLSALAHAVNDTVKEKLRYKINRVAASAPGASAWDCAKRVLPAARDPKNAGGQNRLRSAFCSAASGVPEALALDSVRELLQAVRDPKNADFQEELGYAIKFAAERVPETSALDCVCEWLGAALDPTNADIKIQLTDAIAGAVQRLPEALALDCTRKWLQDSLDPANADIKNQLTWAIGGAAKRVPMNSALDFVRELLRATRKPKNVDIREQLGWAIDHAAERVPESAVLDCVRELLQVAREPKNVDIQERLGWAIQRAAERIPESAVLNCVTELLQASRDPKNGDIKERLTGAVKIVARRVPKGSALDCLGRWLQTARDPQNADIQEQLGSAIEGAAQRVPEASAFDCVREWLRASRDPKIANIKKQLEYAIREGAGRVPEDSALDCVKEWLQGACDSKNADIQWQLGYAVIRAAGRVPEASALDCVRKLLQAANDPKNAFVEWQFGIAMMDAATKIPLRQQFEAVRLALSEDNIELAFRIADAGLEVAILSTWGKEPNDPNGRDGIIFQVKRREEMELAADSVAVPPEIKQMLTADTSGTLAKESSSRANSPIVGGTVIRRPMNLPAGAEDLLLFKGRVYLNGEPIWDIDPEAMGVLEKLMRGEPGQKLKFNDLLSPPEGNEYKNRKKYQDYVRNVVNRLPKRIQSLLNPDRGGFHGGRSFQERVKPRFE